MGAAVAVVPAPGSLPLANARHERFCHEYIIDRNGSATYLRAGYRCTPNAAKVAASNLLTKPNVSERIAYLESARLERVGMTADDVLRELQVLGQSDVRHYRVTAGGKIELAKGVPDVAARAVQSVKVRTRTDADGNTTEEVEYRLWNKPAALRMAGETHGMFKQKVELENKTPQMLESGESMMRRLATELVPRFAALLHHDQRVKMLQAIAGAELAVEGKEVRR